eukprot:IDg5849t1
MPTGKDRQHCNKPKTALDIRRYLSRRTALSAKSAAEAARFPRVRPLSEADELEFARQLAASRAESTFRLATRKSGPHPLDRDYRRDIRPLRSKPQSRRSRKSEGKKAPRRPNKRPKEAAPPLGDKPSSFIDNKIYIKDGWHYCGYCSVLTSSRINFFEHESSAKHKRSLLLVNVPRRLLLSLRKRRTSPMIPLNPKDILDGVRESLPLARTVLADEFFASPLFLYRFLRDTMNFYSSSPLSDEYLQNLNILAEFHSNTNVMALAWLSALLYLSPRQAIDVITTYGFNCMPANLRSPAMSAEERGNTGGRSNQAENPVQPIRSTPDNSEIGSHEAENSQRFRAQEQKLNELTELVQRISSPESGILFRRIHRLRPHLNLCLIFTQFSGYGDIEENLAVFHQSFMSKCRTLHISEPDAFDNLHVLFRPNSPASIFYYKHVQPKAKTLEEAFHMLYSRFLSSERRDRLIYEWNNLKFSTFASKPGVTKHSASCDMCIKASIMQLQLGASYQDDQHLRDSLMNACKHEPWAHRLATMPTNGLLDIQEALARAITAEENLISSSNRSNQYAALSKDINYNANGDDNQRYDRSYDRSGLASRRYGRDTKLQNRTSTWKNRRGPNGKNPIRNHMLMLCRKCDSEYHLLRDCDKLTQVHKSSFAKHILCVESISSGSEECIEALDVIQDFDDDRWHHIETQYSSEAESDDSKEAQENKLRVYCRIRKRQY